MQGPTLKATVLLLLTTAFNPGKANYTCYSSSSPEAKNIRSVYDDHQNTGDFWYRNGSQLVPCTSSSIYSSKCSVCLNDSARPETVLVVLCNLTSSVNLVMEGPNGHIRFNRTGKKLHKHIFLFEEVSRSQMKTRGRLKRSSQTPCCVNQEVVILRNSPDAYLAYNCPGPETMEVWSFSENIRGSSTVSPGVTTRLGDSKPRGVGGRIGLFIFLASFIVLLLILIIRLKCNRQNSQI